MMHSPLFQIFPQFPKNFRTFRKILKILPFPEKFLDFHPPTFFMTFLSSTTNFEFPPYFRCFSTFPPCFAKIILSPYFYKFPPCFRQIHLLFIYFTCISPYFDHDAFMHHPMHVLDASGLCLWFGGSGVTPGHDILNAPMHYSVTRPNQNIGSNQSRSIEEVKGVITDEIIGTSQLGYWRHAPGLPPKSTPMNAPPNGSVQKVGLHVRHAPWGGALRKCDSL